MKSKCIIVSLFLLFSVHVIMAQEKQSKVIKVETNNVSLILKVGENGRLYQSYVGKKLSHDADLAHLPLGDEAYITHGMEDCFEKALQIEHSDNNSSTLLKYISHTNKKCSDGAEETKITLQDDKYPITVNLYYKIYPKEDIIVTHTDITNNEKNSIVLHQFASNMLHFGQNKYILTEYTGDWAREANMSEHELSCGKKVLESKLGTRADMFITPFFQLSLNTSATENTGEVLVGTLAWTGNFNFTFEVDNKNKLRIVSGINPYFSQYTLAPKQVFTTPDFIFTYSCKGRGEASRNFHSWARKYRLKDGDKSRMTLLNNWEATYFHFNEGMLSKLMDDAVKLGVDMFLLDDGWFGNKYPRKDDKQGLGDWAETADKLPNKVSGLIKEATKRNIKFGIWIEPEMVNPKSELYEKHKDWVIHLPNRDEYLYRNQMVLDLSNPKVQDFVFKVVDDLMTNYPGIAFFKWDCNSHITNVYSPYLKDKQTHLYIEYVKGLYSVLNRIKDKYPNLPMMLCSGGGGRVDYEALKYFTEFWASDNTDPIERIFIQYGYSQIFPTKAVCAHVTGMNPRTSIKFRTDVASMGKLGFDIKLSDMNANEADFCNLAVKNYNRLKPVVLDGDMYRLVSPYSSNHASTMFVDATKNHAVVYAFDINPRFRESLCTVRLEGLDANKFYNIQEINIMPGQKSYLTENGKTFSGEYLMAVGLNLFSPATYRSCVVEITAQ
ncbi:MAG: alpha-galactosidase [Muribaculaceae bacterium]